MKTIKVNPLKLVSTTLLLGVACIGVTAQVNLSSGSSATASSIGSSSKSSSLAIDTAFVGKNMRDNRMEIELSQLALDRSTNAGVKKVAQQMITDHTQMLNDLAKIAQSNSMLAIPGYPTDGVAMGTGATGNNNNNKSGNASSGNAGAGNSGNSNVNSDSKGTSTSGNSGGRGNGRQSSSTNGSNGRAGSGSSNANGGSSNGNGSAGSGNNSSANSGNNSSTNSGNTGSGNNGSSNVGSYNNLGSKSATKGNDKSTNESGVNGSTNNTGGNQSGSASNNNAGNNGNNSPASGNHQDHMAMQNMDALHNASGASFDKTWVSQMLTMHQAKLAELNSSVNGINDSELKNVVTQAIPKIQMHIDMLSAINSTNATR